MMSWQWEWGLSVLFSSFSQRENTYIYKKQMKVSSIPLLSPLQHIPHNELLTKLLRISIDGEESRWCVCG